MVEGVQGGQSISGVFTLPTKEKKRKNSGAAKEDKTGKMKSGGPASGSVRPSCDYSSFLTLLEQTNHHISL